MKSTSDISNSASAIVAAINDLLGKTTANNVLVEGNAQSIMGMPDFDLTQFTFSAKDMHIVQDFPQDQALSRNIITAAQANESTPEDEQAESISSAIGFCNTWSAYWPGLLVSLQELKIDVFNQGMLNLQKHIADDLVARGDVHITAIGVYQSAVETVVKALTTHQDVFRKYFDASGVPLDVEKEVSEIQAKMASDNAITARGASKQALGVLIITVVVVATIFSKSGEGEGEEPAPEPPDDNEAANKLIDYSVDMIKDDIIEQTAATEDWKVNFEKYGALVEKLEYDKQMFVVVSHFVSTMNHLVEYLSESATDIADVKQQWNALGTLLADIASEMAKSGGADTSAVVGVSPRLNKSLVAFKEQLVSLQGVGTVRVVNLTEPKAQPSW